MRDMLTPLVIRRGSHYQDETNSRANTSQCESNSDSLLDDAFQCFEDRRSVWVGRGGEGWGGGR